MSIVILIAPFAETAATAWTFVQKAGVSDAAPSRREQLTPQQVQQLMLKTWHQRRRATSLPATPTDQAAQPASSGVLDTIWTELATDLVLGNVENSQFGWCQTLDEHTPTFWQRFDPETRFMLVYEEPTAYVARVIEQDHAKAQDLQGTLQHWHAHHSLLLSTLYALGADAVLVHASQIHSAAVYLGLAASSDTPQMGEKTPPGTEVLAQLLQPLVVANAQVQALWQELQAAAQGPWQEPAPPLPAAHQALVQCLEQQHALETIQQQYQQLAQAQQRLQSELTAQIHAHQSEAAARRDLQTQRDAHQHQLAQLSQQHKDAQEEGELLLTQLHQVQEELESHFLKLQEETKAKATAQQQLQALQKAQAHEQEQNKRQLQEAQEEGELLLAQLHQVQEELENYFLKYQEQRKQYQAVADFWHQHPPAEVWVDMRRTPDGQGWYEAEADGRWSGPGTESSVTLPPLGSGQYLLELHIADAMTPELVAGLQVSAVLDDGLTLSAELIHEFGGADNLYPMVSACLLDLPTTQGNWQLRLTLPEVISPVVFGGSDTRQLGLRLKGLSLSLSQQTLVDAPTSQQAPIASDITPV